MAPPSRGALIRAAAREAAKKRHVLADETPATIVTSEGLRMSWPTVLDLENATDEDLRDVGVTWEDNPL